MDGVLLGTRSYEDIVSTGGLIEFLDDECRL